jgi:hypothetical protein
MLRIRRGGTEWANVDDVTGFQTKLGHLFFPSVFVRVTFESVPLAGDVDFR